MKLPAYASVLAFLIVSVFGLAVTDHYLLGSESLASVISAVLVDLTNGDRSADSLGGLTASPVLTAAAQAKADDMAAKGYFAHVSPDGKNSWYWFKQEGYTFLYAGENLAVDFSDSNDVESAWMNSPTHRANILDGHFTQIGIATAQGVYAGHPTTFVVQMFGTPAAVAAPVAVVETVSSPSEPTVPALATTKPVVPPKRPVIAKAATAATTSRVVATAPRVATTAAPRLVLGVTADSILPASATWWEHLITSPKTMLRYGYYALAIIVLVLLAYVTELEFHRRHRRHVVAAVLLFMLMAGLFMFADFILFSQPVVAAGVGIFH